MDEIRRNTEVNKDIVRPMRRRKLRCLSEEQVSEAGSH
jgi:hypothetical protein